MKSVDEYCEVLGIDPSASPEHFKQAYRDLVKVWHPDRFSHDRRLQRKAEEKIKEINDAYQQLQSFFADANRRQSRSTNASESKPTGTKRKREEPRRPPPKPQAARTQQTEKTSPPPDGDATKANDNDGSFSSPASGSGQSNAHVILGLLPVVVSLAAIVAVLAIGSVDLRRPTGETVPFSTTSAPLPDISAPTYPPRKPFVLPLTNDTPEDKAFYDRLRAKQASRAPANGKSNDRPSSAANNEIARSRTEILKKTQETVEGAEKLLALHEAELKRLTEEYERRRELYYQGSINRNEVMQAE
jgi:curved DNA-binding protein CbpA